MEKLLKKLGEEGWEFNSLGTSSKEPSLICYRETHQVEWLSISGDAYILCDNIGNSISDERTEKIVRNYLGL